MKMKTFLVSAFSIFCFWSPYLVKGSLIISQYYEGTSSDKWIEIYNTDSASVDLSTSGFYLGLWSNANREGWKTSVAPNNQVLLSGTIAGYATFLVRNGSALNPSYATANQTASTVINFNGDDSVGLWQSIDATYSFGELVDVFGVTANSFIDLSYSRKPTQTAGTTSDFSSSLWDQYTLAQVNGAVSGSNERLGSFTPVPEPTTWAGIIFGALFCGAQVVRRWRAVRP